MKRETTAVVIITLALSLLGVLMVYSVSEVNADLRGLHLRQAMFFAAGVVAMLIAAKTDYHRLASPLIFRSILFVTIALLGLVLIPGIGVRVNGAQRWINLGGFGFQPSELAKFALVVLLAVKLAQNRQTVEKFWTGFLPPLLVAGVFAALVYLERDLGIPVLMVGVAFVMLFVAGARWHYLAGSFVPAVFLIFALILTSPHRVKRLTAFLDPWEDRLESGFNLIQSLSAFAQGGAWGRGAGASEQKLGYLFGAHTDFIFAVVGEEFGLAGTLGVVALFACLLLVSIRVAAYAPDLFGALLATGIATLIAGQAVFVMAVNTGLVPTKGLPLPFVSNGGTALVVFLAMTGVLANIATQAREPEERPQRTLIPAT